MNLVTANTSSRFLVFFFLHIRLIGSGHKYCAVPENIHIPLDKGMEFPWGDPVGTVRP